MSSKAVQVQVFALLREENGNRPLEVELEFPLQASQLKAELQRVYPDLAALIGRSRLAVDLEFVQDDQVLTGEHRELALIPPVSGG
ncbi:MAG: MoaD/ThiS family protein [Planctomycetota bacterium]|nr:MAG: MoaD/ThiS family protein [Planctomycetota bacterium]